MPNVTRRLANKYSFPNGKERGGVRPIKGVYYG
jgi:hypothetical protein